MKCLATNRNCRTIVLVGLFSALFLILSVGNAHARSSYWSYDGTQGSAAIKEWNGSSWDTIATGYYAVATDFSSVSTDAHATIYCVDASTAQTPSQNTWTKVTGFTTDGLEVNCNADAAHDRIAITVTGQYEVRCQVSFSGDGLSTVQWRIYSGSTPASTYLKCTRMLGTGGDVGSASLTGTLQLAAGDYVELWVKSDDVTPSITPKDMQLSVHKIG